MYKIYLLLTLLSAMPFASAMQNPQIYEVAHCLPLEIAIQKTLETPGSILVRHTHEDNKKDISFSFYSSFKTLLEDVPKPYKKDIYTILSNWISNSNRTIIKNHKLQDDVYNMWYEKNIFILEAFCKESEIKYILKHSNPVLEVIVGRYFYDRDYLPTTKAP